MSVAILHPEVFGVTESSLTLYFDVVDDSGPVDAVAEVALDGEVRAVSSGPGGTRYVRIEGLEPATEYGLEIRVAGAEPVQPQRYFPGRVSTLPRPTADCVGSFATMNDLHFGEPHFGGVLGDDFEPADGEVDPSEIAREGDTDVPYSRFMNEDAIAEINKLGADMVIIKGDIADRGQPSQFATAASAFAGFDLPCHAFLGNHDYYALNDGEEVDGYALLGQPPAPRTLDLGGWRLVLLETVEPGHHHGVFHDDRIGWLARVLEETRETGTPTLLLMHHHPVPPEHADRFPNTIGIRPDHSLRLFDLVGGYPQVKGVLIGHTHRNRVRRYPASGATPWIEVNCTKDYPGGYAHYRLFQDGTVRQEVRRTSSERALLHSSKCRGFFGGFYRDFALGDLARRSFVIG